MLELCSSPCCGKCSQLCAVLHSQQSCTCVCPAPILSTNQVCSVLCWHRHAPGHMSALCSKLPLHRNLPKDTWACRFHRKPPWPDGSGLGKPSLAAVVNFRSILSAPYRSAVWQCAGFSKLGSGVCCVCRGKRSACEQKGPEGLSCCPDSWC